jgi:hypothetical protein
MPPDTFHGSAVVDSCGGCALGTSNRCDSCDFDGFDYDFDGFDYDFDGFDSLSSSAAFCVSQLILDDHKTGHSTKMPTAKVSASATQPSKTAQFYQPGAAVLRKAAPRATAVGLQQTSYA